MLGVVCLSRPRVPACPRVPSPRVPRPRIPRPRIPRPRIPRPRVPRPRVPRPRVPRPRVPRPRVPRPRVPRPRVPSPRPTFSHSPRKSLPRLFPAPFSDAPLFSVKQNEMCAHISVSQDDGRSWYDTVLLTAFFSHRSFSLLVYSSFFFRFYGFFKFAKERAGSRHLSPFFHQWYLLLLYLNVEARSECFHLTPEWTWHKKEKYQEKRKTRKKSRRKIERERKKNRAREKKIEHAKKKSSARKKNRVREKKNRAREKKNRAREKKNRTRISRGTNWAP